VAGFPAHDGAVTAAAVCEDGGGSGTGTGHQLVTASVDKTVAVWWGSLHVGIKLTHNP
jgi:hypothetical protein